MLEYAIFINKNIGKYIRNNILRWDAQGFINLRIVLELLDWSSPLYKSNGLKFGKKAGKYKRIDERVSTRELMNVVSTRE